MSGLFDKKTDGNSRREARTKKEQDAQKKSRIIAVSVISVLAVVFIGSLFLNSNFIRRATPAVTVGNMTFTAAEFDYFYNVAIFEYSEFVNAHMPDFAAALLPSRDRPFASQIHDHETGATWADFFIERALENMSELVQLYTAAMEYGFELTAENRADIDNQFHFLIMEGEMAASMQPHIHPNAMSFLQAVYGSSLNESTLRRVLEFTFTALFFSEHVRESFSYSAAELEAHYLEYSDELDIFRYRVMLVSPERTDPLDFETGAEFEEAQDAAAEEALLRAAEILATVVTEEDFIAAALEFDEVLYSDPRSTLVEQQGSFVDPDFIDWLSEPGRAEGDITSFEEAHGTYILFFVERDSNNYNLVAMRQILLLREHVAPEAFYDGEDDPEFIEAVENAEADARARAELALEFFQTSGSTEEAFLDVMEVFTDDTTEGGFYDEIAKFSYFGQDVRTMRVVEELEQWLFDESRQVGDYEIVRTEAFGYHILFFYGRGELFRHFIAADRMRDSDHTEWRENLPAVWVGRHRAFVLTQQ
ncbi:MAG: hypothetical protein FWB97_05920 [Oscillospiraceae bacterium]|nr:hypothetical protein [Oscillospiraceae bacterium]